MSSAASLDLQVETQLPSTEGISLRDLVAMPDNQERRQALRRSVTSQRFIDMLSQPDNLLADLPTIPARGGTVTGRLSSRNPNIDFQLRPPRQHYAETTQMIGRALRDADSVHDAIILDNIPDFLRRPLRELTGVERAIRFAHIYGGGGTSQRLGQLIQAAGFEEVSPRGRGRPFRL